MYRIGWVVVLVISLSFSAFGQKQQYSAEDMQAMFEEYQKLNTPGPGHEVLNYFEGNWSTVSRILMPGMENMEGRAEMEFEWILGGRFLYTTAKGEMMPGMPYEGVSLFGYDNNRKQYVQSNVDVTSTALFTFAGVYDKANNAIILWGSMDEPTTGEYNKMSWMIYRMQDKDHCLLEMHDSALGLENTKVMEVEMTRK